MLIAVSSFESYLLTWLPRIFLHMWHLRGIFVASTYMAIPWQIKDVFPIFGVMCALMYGMQVQYSSNAVKHVSSMVDIFVKGHMPIM